MRNLKFITLAGLTLLNLILLPHYTNANNPSYLYRTRIDPSTQRYVAKKNFKTIESKFAVTNVGEDALYVVTADENSGKLETKIIYLSKDQTWSDVTAPILLKSKESTIFSTIITRKGDSIEEKDYYVNTNFRITPVYTPPSSKDVIKVMPEVVATTIVAVNESGFTNVNASVAYFTNTSGPVVTESNGTDLIILIQNLDKYSISLEGEMLVKDPSGIEKTIQFSPAIIRANGQSYISNQSDRQSILIGDPLKFGKYDLSAKFRVFPNKNPTIFTNYSFWSIPKLYIYACVFILLILFIVSSMYFIFAKGSKNE